MTLYSTTPAASYKESSILTAPPERLVVMLYDGARRFLKQASAAMEERDLARANDRLKKAEAVIEELLTTLDLSAGEVAERLQGLYVFCRRTLSEARLEQSPEKIGHVSDVLAGLREGFAGIAGGETAANGAADPAANGASTGPGAPAGTPVAPPATPAA